MHAATETIGLMASLSSFIIGLPHAARVWKHRHDPRELRGISLGTQWIGLAGAVLWSAYAVQTAQVWVGAPQLVNGPIALATVVVLRRAARDRAGATSSHEAAPVPPALRELDRTAGTHRPVVVDRELVAA